MSEPFVRAELVEKKHAKLRTILRSVKGALAAFLSPIPLLLRIIVSARGLDMLAQIALFIVAIIGIAGYAATVSLSNSWVSSAIEAYADARKFWPIFGQTVGIFIGVAVSLILLEISRLLLALLWRKILLQRLVLHTYFAEQTMYHLGAASSGQHHSEGASYTDNPDQRITNDAYIFCEYSAQIVVRGTSLVATCIVAIAFLLRQASSTWIQIIVLIPFILCNIVFYNVIALWVARGVVQVEHAEGDFRFSHARVREFAESIAFLQGSEAERSNTSRLFARLINLTKRLAVKFMTLTFYDTLSVALLQAILFTMLVSQVQHKWSPFNDPSLTSAKIASIITNIYLQTNVVAQSQQQVFQLSSMIVYIAGAGARVAQLLASCSSIAKQKKMMEQSAQGKVEFVEDRIELDGVTVSTPAQGKADSAAKVLVKDLSLTVIQGQNLIITGKSGCGKSSILRIIAGLWKSQSGTVRRPKLIGLDGIFFVPQRPYIIKGNLKEQIMFPMTLEEYQKSIEPLQPSPDEEPASPTQPTDASLLDALRRANLLSLRDKIDWDDRSIVLQNTLSGGEMQRLGFARLFFHRPRFAIIDEGTAAMDAENELIMYEQCKELGITLISVAHRSTLLKFHQMRLHVLGDELAGYTLEPVEIVEPEPGSAGSSPLLVDLNFADDNNEEEANTSATTPSQVPLLPGQQGQDRNSTSSDFESQVDNSTSSLQRLQLFFKYAFHGFVSMIDTRSRKDVLRSFVEWFSFLVLVAATTVVAYLCTALPQLSLDSMVASNFKTTWAFVGALFAMAIILIVLMPLMAFSQRRLGIRWRENSTRALQKRYFTDNAFYKLNVLDQAYEAPGRVGDSDQRISVDVDFVASGLREYGAQRYFMTTVRSIVNILVAIGVSIYALHWSAPLLALVWLLPGFVIQGVLNLVVSRIQVRQQRKEGDFRFDLARIREFAEQICFFHGEKSEQANIEADFRAVLREQSKLCVGQIVARSVSFIIYQIGVCIGLLIVAMIVFTGIVPYSAGKMATMTTLAIAQMSFLFSSATQITDFAPEFIKSFGSMVRIGQLLVRSRELARTKAYEQSQPEQVRSGPDGALAVDALSFAAAGKQLKQRTLVKDLNLELKAGDRLLVKGPSGSGKSSLLRVVAGLWPFQRGTITRPTSSSSYGVTSTTPLSSTSSMAIIFENQSIDPGANSTSLPQLKGMQFVPQRAYVPLGISLGAVVTYPEPFTPQVADRVRECINKVGLGYLLDRYASASDLDTAQHLQTVLSEGEQQRLAFARVLFQRPSLIILDESTSALDEDNEKLMYSLIQETLPGATVMSVGHRETLNAFHLQVLRLYADQSNWKMYII